MRLIFAIHITLKGKFSCTEVASTNPLALNWNAKEKLTKNIQRQFPENKYTLTICKDGLPHP